jgi:hypothetical protein
MSALVPRRRKERRSATLQKREKEDWWHNTGDFTAIDNP